MVPFSSALSVNSLFFFLLAELFIKNNFAKATFKISNGGVKQNTDICGII